jgi:hypothetical protein
MKQRLACSEPSPPAREYRCKQPRTLRSCQPEDAARRARDRIVLHELDQPRITGGKPRITLAASGLARRLQCLIEELVESVPVQVPTPEH